jgi:glutamine cyclotransferase
VRKVAVLVVAMVCSAAACAADSSNGASGPVDSSSTTTVDTSSTATEADAVETSEPALRTITVIEVYDHDSAYTQGLEWIDGGRWEGRLLESAGRYGESRLRIWDPIGDPDGPPAALVQTELSDDLFAEGATVVGDRVWQLTWTAGRAFVYDLDTLEPVAEFAYETEGWGLCLLDGVLVRSDGTDRLWFHRPDDFEVVSTVEVTADGLPVEAINELECVPGADSEASGRSADDRIWANIYQSNNIIAIDPESGVVTDVVDASALVPPGYEGDTDRVLNGIAYQPDTGRFWLTGKRWPALYEVRID